MQEIRICQNSKIWTSAKQLPDGIYNGTWSGYLISWNINLNEYWTESDLGVRGTVKVLVTIQDGEIRVKEAGT